MELKRAYSVLNVKEIDEEKREITGIATTPTTDRVGDIVEPKGAEYTLPLPLLWQHDHGQPIGHVLSAKATGAGIEIRARLARVDEPGRLKDRLDEAWQSIKAKLVRGLSIGFRSIEHSYIEGTNGIRFMKWEWLELSTVTVPANSDCSIQMIRSLDTAARCAALGAGPGSASNGHQLPGASGARSTSAKSGAQPTPSRGSDMKTTAEQIASFEAKRAAADARMKELMGKAAEEGRTLDEPETEEYDGLAADVEAIDKHLVRLRSLEKFNAAAAKLVTGADGVSPDRASEARGGRVISMERNLPKGTAFTRYAIALARSKGNLMQAVEISKTWKDTPEVEQVLKAAAAAGTTTDADWAAPLVYYTNLVSEFVDLLRPQTIIGRIPSLRRVPFNVRMPAQTAGGTYGWVGENAPKPVGELAFSEITLRWAKASGIIVLTDELVRQSNPTAESIVRDDMLKGIAQFLDGQFVDPSVAEVSNVSPASITNGVTPVNASGTTADDVRTDVGNLWQTFLDSNLVPTSGVWIMSNVVAMRLSLMLNPLGQREFPDITPTGGTFFGYPVITSESVPTKSDGGLIIFANANDVFLAEEGLMIDVSREASLQMNTTPDSPPTASTVMVSLWQNNLIGLRAERYINWKKRRSAAVGYIDAVKYGT